MKQRKRPEGRKVWSAPRRCFARLSHWAYNFFIGPFLTRFPDGTIQASMTRICTAGLMFVEVWRLRPQPAPGGMWLVPVIGWPDAFLAFCILFALPLDKALTTVAERNPEKLVDALLSRMGVGDVAASAFNGLTGPANDGAPGGDLSE